MNDKPKREFWIGQKYTFNGYDKKPVWFASPNKAALDEYRGGLKISNAIHCVEIQALRDCEKERDELRTQIEALKTLDLLGKEFDKVAMVQTYPSAKALFTKIDDLTQKLAVAEEAFDNIQSLKISGSDVYEAAQIAVDIAREALAKLEEGD